MKGNGVAALKVWPVTVDLGGATYRIAPLPAIRWVIPLFDGDLFGVVPGLLDSESAEAVSSGLLAGTISHQDCLVAARSAVGVASGVPWWAAVRLVQSALSMPDVIGEMTIDGVDSTTVSLGGFVFAAYRVFTRDADKKQRDKIDREIMATPPGLSIAERQAAQGNRGSGFEEMMRQRGGS